MPPFSPPPEIAYAVTWGMQLSAVGRRLAEVPATPGRLLSEFSSDIEAAIIVSLQDTIALTADQVAVSFGEGSNVIGDVQVPTEAEATLVADAVVTDAFAISLENLLGDYAVALTQDPVISTVDMTPPSSPPPDPPTLPPAAGLFIGDSTSEINVGGISSGAELSAGGIVGVVFGALLGAIVIAGATWYAAAKRNEMRTHVILKSGSSVGAQIRKAESTMDDIDIDGLDLDEVTDAAAGTTSESKV